METGINYLHVDDFVLGHVSTDMTACLFQHDQQLR